MPNTTVYTNNQYYQDIAAAIRRKNGLTTSYKPSEMAPAIDSLIVSGQAITLQNKIVTPTTTALVITKDAGYTGLGTVTVNAIQTETRTVTQNGTVTPATGKFFSSITVSVPSSGTTINNRSLTVTPTESSQTFSVPSGYTGLGPVTVEGISPFYIGSNIPRQAGDLIIPTDTTQTIIGSGIYTTGVTSVAPVPTDSENILTSNGVHTPASGKWFDSVTVSVPATTVSLQTKTVTYTPSETAQTATVTPGTGYGGLSKVTVNVNAISSTYIGSGIPQDPTLTISDNQIIIPTGYYSTTQTATVATATLATPEIGVNNSGLITAILEQENSGYIFAGTTSDSVQLATKAATTITPKSSAQTAVAAGIYTTGAITVAAVPTETKTVTANGTYAPTSGRWFSSVTVNVPVGATINNQNITITPNETTQTFTASSGYTGLGTVTVNAISSTYVGSGIATRGSSDLTASGAVVTVPAGYYSTQVTKSVATVTQATPAAAITNSTGIISATATQGAGYVSAGTKTGTTQLTVQAGKTVTPTAANQTAVASYRWTTGTITVAAVPTDTNNSFSVNGTYTPASGKWFDEITIAVPSGVNNEAAKTVTPSTATQTITPGSGYSGLSKVTVNPIPSNYITTTDATATASEILAPKTAYVNGSKVTGTMTNRGAVTTTITTQGGSYTIPAGYHNGSGKVTASLAVSTISNADLNIATVTESTNDYGVQANITIPAGYYNATTLSALISGVLPFPHTAAATPQILSGYEAYDDQLNLLAGTMTNNAQWNATLDQTTTSVTIPAGYHNGTGKVSHTTVNIPDPTISIANSTGIITATGSWTRGFTTDNSYTKTYTLTTQAGTTITPTESSQTAVAAYKWTTGTVTVAAVSSTYVGSEVTRRSSTDLTVSGGTVTAPAGYYAESASKSVASMTVPTATSASGSGTRKIIVTPSTTSQYINLPTGYNSATAYFQINAMAAGSATPQASISATGANISVGNGTLTFSKSITLTPQVTAGYISAGTSAARTVSLTATVTTKAAATYTPGTANQTITASQYLTGTQTILGDADLVAGNIKAGVNIFNVNGTFTSDATATASDIVSPKTAYVNGSKVTGNLVVNKYYTGASAPASSLGNNGDIYFQSGGSL